MVDHEKSRRNTNQRISDEVSEADSSGVVDSWMAKKTNEGVLETTRVDRSLFATVKQRKLSYFGRILRWSGDCSEKKVIPIPGSRTHGRPKTAWIDNITSWTGLPLHQLL